MESFASVGKSTQPRGTRRVWSQEEEKVLAQLLKDLVVRGWKCDNGFRSGYTHVLEQYMSQAFPGTDIRAEPHISSKIHIWEKHYGTLTMMLGRSEFSWNETSHTIGVKDDAHWNQFVKEDANAKTMRIQVLAVVW
ncbi:hypothetical protein PHJA_002020700 [Phtheirospermum japonicum]|uniref:Myb/SANT-like domain-containing protein n=1 Tax=Phtheirospermum japonicum TaxID=374723 RepID=A0A830CN30_9LAMI|nr:hypothetical protein PHJA_002020700 [Phtheirospermum japonicum]